MFCRSSLLPLVDKNQDMWLALFFLLGAAVGSFINVIADRLPAGKSIISPPSHCTGCQRELSTKDLIPIFSYLWLKGRCRHCGVTIPRRLLWVELGTAILLAFLYWHYGPSWELALVALYCCLFIVLSLIDLKHNILPNKIVYPAVIFAIVIAALGSIFGFEPRAIAGTGFRLWIVDAAIGGGIGFVLLLLPALLYRGGMGWGDIKLATLIGLVTGFPLVLIAMFLAIVSGGLIAAILLLLKLKSRKDAIPFGPFLSLAAMATLFWGSNLLNWLIPS
ncbi:MAG: prepilin peptidase [Chloroflexi bacterium]|nr:prepilin peptidase [Chloroflexota bacterium]